MASRVSCGVLWFDTYINMLHLYAKKVFGVDIDRQSKHTKLYNSLQLWYNKYVRY